MASKPTAGPDTVVRTLGTDPAMGGKAIGETRPLQWAAIFATQTPHEVDPVAPSGTFNPWLSIWMRPRATMRHILDTDPGGYVLALAAAGRGSAAQLDRATQRNAGDVLSLPTILVLAVILGPIGGILVLYLGGALDPVDGQVARRRRRRPTSGRLSPGGTFRR